MSENQLNLENHILVCIEVNVAEEDLEEYRYLKSNFCGQVLYPKKEDLATLKLNPRSRHGIIFVCGNVKLLNDLDKDMISKIKVIVDFSFNIKSMGNVETVTLGEVILSA